VLIAGKGHETYQEIAGRRLPFSDALEAEEELARWADDDLREAATAIGRASSGGCPLRFGATDSRTLERGALFVALRGERLDGRRFIGAARERGAAAAIVEEPDASQGDLPFLVVENSRFCTRCGSRRIGAGISTFRS